MCRSICAPTLVCAPTILKQPPLTVPARGEEFGVLAIECESLRTVRFHAQIGWKPPKRIGALCPKRRFLAHLTYVKLILRSIETFDSEMFRQFESIPDEVSRFRNYSKAVADGIEPAIEKGWLKHDEMEQVQSLIILWASRSDAPTVSTRLHCNK